MNFLCCSLTSFLEGLWCWKWRLVPSIYRGIDRLTLKLSGRRSLFRWTGFDFRGSHFKFWKDVVDFMYFLKTCSCFCQTFLLKIPMLFEIKFNSLQLFEEIQKTKFWHLQAKIVFYYAAKNFNFFFFENFEGF